MDLAKGIQELLSRKSHLPVSPDGLWWYRIHAKAMAPVPGGHMDWDWDTCWVQKFDHEIDTDEATSIADSMIRQAGFERYLLQLIGFSAILAPESLV